MPPRRRMFHSFSVKNYTMQTPVWQPQSGREFANNGRLCYTYFAFAKFTAGFSEKGASAMGQPLWLNFTARPEEAGLTLRNFLRQQGVKGVHLMPLMLVAGDHAINDMASDEEDSWKTLFNAAGITATPWLNGLGENPAVRAMFVAHLQQALSLAMEEAA